MDFKVGDIIVDNCYAPIESHYLIIKTVDNGYDGAFFAGLQINIDHPHCPIWFKSDELQFAYLPALSELVLYGPHEGRVERFDHLFDKQWEDRLSKRYIGTWLK